MKFGRILPYRLYFKIAKKFQIIMKNNPHKVIIAMGSQSDWKTLKFTSSILTN